MTADARRHEPAVAATPAAASPTATAGVASAAGTAGATVAFDVSRRGAVAALAAGFAAAVMPVSADTITTSAEGLSAGEVQIPTADGMIPAYRTARPAAAPSR